MKHTLTLPTALLLAPLAALHAAASRGADLTLQSPPDRSVTHLSIPFFGWQDVVAYPFAGTYEIQIARDRDFVELVDKDAVPALANYYVPAKELTPGEHSWRVRYVNEKQQPSQWSATASFRIKEFTGADVVRVPVGASWDDIADAYQAALDLSARRPADNPGVELRFEKEVYALEQPAGKMALFETPPGQGGVVINGQGASFVLKARGREVCGFFRADGPGSSNIQIKNCVVDYDPSSLGIIAGRVVEADRRTGRFTVALLPAYAAMRAQFSNETSGMFLAGETFQRKTGGTRDYTGQGWGQAWSPAKQKYEFTVSPSALQAVEPGDYWVSERLGGGDLFTIRDGVSDLVVNSNVFYSARNRIGNIGEKARFIENGFLRKEGRVWCIPKGGFGTLATQHTWIENNVIQGTRDDMYHLLHGYGVCRGNTLESAYRSSIWLHGERIWVEGNTIRYAGGNGIQIGGKGISTLKLGDAETRLTSTEYRGLHCLIIRNNTIVAPYAGGICSSRPDSNVFAAVRFKGITEPQYEGFQFTDILIEGNTIIDAARTDAMYIHGKNIQIRKNSILNRAASQFATGSETEIGIHIDRSRNVEISGNRMDDKRIREDRRMVIRQTEKAIVDGQPAADDDPAMLLDYRNLQENGLAFWYKLDESQGQQAFDSVRKVFTPVTGVWETDQGVSGLSLTGQAYHANLASWRPEGKAGTALRLNGRTDALEMDSHHIFTSQSPEFSASMFFNGDEFGKRAQVLLEARGNDDVPGGLRLVAARKEIRAEVFSGKAKTVVAVPFYYDKYWQHVAVVFDRSRLQLFLNGYRVMEKTGACATLPALDSICVGAGYDDAGKKASYFKGMVDDVRVYRRNLKEIGPIYGDNKK